MHCASKYLISRKYLISTEYVCLETNTRDVQIQSGVLVHLVYHFCYDDDANDDGDLVRDDDGDVVDDGDDDNNVDDDVVDEKLNLDSSYSEVINAVYSNLKRTKLSHTCHRGTFLTSLPSQSLF